MEFVKVTSESELLPYLCDALERFFPPEEREPREFVVQQVRTGEGLTSWVAVDGGVPIGFVRGMARGGAGWIIHIALEPHARGARRGDELLRAGIQAIGGVRGTYLEVERVEDAADDDERGRRLKRLAFFERNGAVLITAAYLQPPSAPGFPWVPLNLLWIGEPVTDPEGATRRFYADFFGLAPTDCEEVASALASFTI